MAISEFDSRQVAKMGEQIASFQSGYINLGELIEDLLFLRNTLEECDDDWEVEFTSKLTDLESVNSYLIEKNMSKLDNSLAQIVDNAILQLKKLLTEY